MSLYNEPVITPFYNKMELVTIANELVGTSQVGFATGSRNDPPDAIGIGHGFEHLACRGASPQAVAAITQRHNHRPSPVTQRQADRCYRRFFGGSNGPGINIYTLHSTMGFGHQDLFKPRYLPHVFYTMGGMVRDVMYDMYDMRNREDTILSPRAWFVEKGAVDNETADNDERAEMEAYRQGLKLLYATNPARNYGDSEPEHLTRMKVGRVKQWAQGNIVSSRMKVVIIGPSRNAAVRMLRKVGLNKLPDHAPVPWHYDRSDDVPALDGIRTAEVIRSCKKHHVHLFWPTETFMTRDALALEVLSGILKERIEEEFREHNHSSPGGVYHPAVEWDASSSHGTLEAWFSTTGGRAHCDDLTGRLLEVVERLKEDESDLLAEDVDDRRNYLADAYLEQYRFMPGTIADMIIDYLANGDAKLERFRAYPDAVRRVTPHQVRKAARKYLHTDRFVQAITRPAP